MHVVVEHRFENTDVETFVEVYYSEEFNRAVAPLASLREREVVSVEELDDGKVRRRVRMVPDVKLPGPVQRLVDSARIEYFEVSEYDPTTQRARYAIESQAGDAVQVDGEISFQDEGGGVRRKIEGDVVVRVFALGGLIEKLIAREVASRYDAIQEFTQRWLDERRAGSA